LAGHFPRRRVAALAVSAALVVSLGMPSVGSLASARTDGDLTTRKHHVNAQIDSHKVDLDEVSARLIRATAALQRARNRLTGARSDLAAARGRVAAAIALDARAAAALADAVQSLAIAERQATDSRIDEAALRERVASLAVQQFQGSTPQLLGLSLILNAGKPQDVTTGLTAVDTVLNAGASSLDSLTATRVLLAEQEERVAAFRLQVAERRRAAAANLVSRQRAERQAEVIKHRVADLVSQRRAARGRAAVQVARERHRLVDLRAERQRIKRMLKARARRASTAGSSGTSTTTATGQSGGYLSAPVDAPITSPYGMRLHPILLVWKLHDGTDFGAGCGTPIHAAADGTVIEEYYNEGYGNRVIIDDGVVDGINLATSYNHLEGYSAYVGQHVNRGDVIGYVGTTGYSTGCHLHFMVYENGVTVDPMTWL